MIPHGAKPMSLINALKKIGKIAYRLWMGLSFVMGWIMTRVILIVLFYGVVTPIALLARLFGKRFLDTSYRGPSRQSYWHEREKEANTETTRYEKQF